MSHPFTIRQAEPGDVPAVVELWSELALLHADIDACFAIAPDAREGFRTFLQEHLSSEQSMVWVAESSGSTVGYCLATVAERPPVLADRKYGSIFDVAVTHTHRRLGIGRALVERTEQWFAERGIHRAELRVAVGNDLADRFWAALGYRPYIETRYREL
jgi:ribosomal protein S18 acetylase RimI-like enzyme